jgi:hypothetical protein
MTHLDRPVHASGATLHRCEQPPGLPAELASVWCAHCPARGHATNKDNVPWVMTHLAESATLRIGVTWDWSRGVGAEGRWRPGRARLASCVYRLREMSDCITSLQQSGGRRSRQKGTHETRHMAIDIAAKRQQEQMQRRHHEHAEGKCSMAGLHLQLRLACMAPAGCMDADSMIMPKQTWMETRSRTTRQC